MQIFQCIWLISLFIVASHQQLDIDESNLDDITGVCDEDRCWLKSYGRGIGRPLSTCPSGYERSGALCYPPCRQGFTGVAFVCWQNCPNGFTDIGVSCRKPTSYGRGAGYPLWDADKCNRDHSQGCEQHGLIHYPKCKEGFSPFGCCVCSPNCVNGMHDSGAHCVKNTYTRGAGVPMNCQSHEQYDAGLCYDRCKGSNYRGIGPVCWAGCPTGWNRCGAMCLEKSTCTEYLKKFLQPATDAIKSIFDKDGKAAAEAGRQIVDNLLFPVCNEQS